VLKLIVEIIVSIALHTLAYILCIINIVTRKDLSGPVEGALDPDHLLLGHRPHPLHRAGRRRALVISSGR
jgi:hypothetical protein